MSSTVIMSFFTPWYFHSSLGVVSTKEAPKPIQRRNSSFFLKKMMSMKSFKVAVGDDDDEDDEENGDDHSSTSDASMEKQAAAGGTVAKPSQKATAKPAKPVIPYYDPPMPNLGVPVNVDALVSRNRRAESGLQMLMSMVNQDANMSIEEAGSIPVAHTIDRISVTLEAAARMSRIRTTAGINNAKIQSIKDTQKSLNYRKSGLIMMNANYSKVQVRKIEPIYVNEARTLVDHKT